MWNYAKYPAACTMQSFQTTQLTFTCSKLSIETLEKGVKRSKLTIKTQDDVSDVVLVFILHLVWNF